MERPEAEEIGGGWNGLSDLYGHPGLSNLEAEDIFFYIGAGPTRINAWDANNMDFTHPVRATYSINSSRFNVRLADETGTIVATVSENMFCVTAQYLKENAHEAIERFAKPREYVVRVRAHNYGTHQLRQFDERAAAEPAKKQRTAAWAVSLNHGIVFDDTWKVVDDLEILIKRLKAKQVKDGKMKGGDNRHDYAAFVKELGVLRTRADGARSREEAFDGQMAIGRILYEHQLYKEALVSFKRACELQPTDH
ncbi:hypothetical protein RHGRI_015880 [Rhododendron griersonianum]|uniref:Uncharacterized protein n=1 Tax=Rhododendron griersonianum TaxID=479676 RepID=A0AAV6JQF4_9ERIC|nr:hypothetical protein RHGRI_015880 [Rhododendron griersonianum]